MLFVLHMNNLLNSQLIFRDILSINLQKVDEREPICTHSQTLMHVRVILNKAIRLCSLL
jgi:hypothetical protein